MVSVKMFILVMIFGSSSWIGTNSIWMQLPLVVAKLPESWNLPSYLTVIVQIACISPLVYTVLHLTVKKYSITPTTLITGFLIIACICQTGLIFLWDKQAEIFSHEHSVGILSLMFGLALVDAVSSVLFMPFMSQFHPALLNAYFIGMGFSALIPSVLSLIQGAGTYKCIDNNGTMIPEYTSPVFSVEVFFGIISFWTYLALASFIALIIIAKRRRDGISSSSPNTALTELTRHDSNTTSDTSEESSKVNKNIQKIEGSEETTVDTTTLSIASVNAKNTQKYNNIYILLMTALVNAQMNGVITSIQNYATNPYSQETYHFGITLSNISSPLASFLTFFFTVRSMPWLGVLTLTTSALTAFVVYLAALSPDLIFNSPVGGSIISVTTIVIVSGLHNYLRMVFATLLREQNKSETRLLWCGAFIQIGSFIGSMIMFPLVSIFKVFHDAPPCR